MNRRQFLGHGGVLLLSLSKAGVVMGETSWEQGKATGFVYDPLYLEHWLEPGHPESPQRLQSIMTAMEKSGLLQQVRRVKPLPGALPYLYLVHTREHVDSIRAGYGHSHDVTVAAVGGVLAAVQEVGKGGLRNAFCAVRPPGHHARNTGREEGFCLYNIIAIAARYAQRELGLKKVLIVDWDYHHGDGTEAFFYADPTVLFFSTHDLHAYPGTGHPSRTGVDAGEGYNINVPLDCGATDDDMVRAFEEKLLPAARRFRPDLILVSAGFDSRRDDLLGCFDVTDEGYMRLTRIVMQLADQYCNGRIVSVLEGGYNLAGLASAVVAHVRTLLENQ